MFCQFCYDFYKKLHAWLLLYYYLYFIIWLCKEQRVAGRRGEWLTQSTAIDISRQSGIARAVHAGTSVVKYNVTSDSITQTDVSLQLYSDLVFSVVQLSLSISCLAPWFFIVTTGPWKSLNIGLNWKRNKVLVLECVLILRVLRMLHYHSVTICGCCGFHININA